MVEASDVVFVVVLLLCLVGLTVQGVRGDKRAVDWGRIFARFVGGPIIVIVLFNKLREIRNSIDQLQVILGSTPRAPIGQSAEAIRHLAMAVTATNVLSLVVAVLAMWYSLFQLPRIVAARSIRDEVRQGLPQA